MEHKFNSSITDLRKARTDCPDTSITAENIDAVKKMILDKRRITIRGVADDVGISFSSCQEIFTDGLSMKSTSAKIVPKLLNF